MSEENDDRGEVAVLILSGGMDSTTLLYDLLSRGLDVWALSIDYGQRHGRELRAARSTCEKLGIPHQVVDLSGVSEVMKGSSLTDDVPVPHGHYEEETMKQTVVPSRNLIFLSVASAYAISVGAEVVYYGAHGGDHAIYPDCRPVFIDKVNEVLAVANYEPVRVEAPYVGIDKVGILRRGLELGVDYSLTWTCYEGKEKACGKCGSCVERLEAFRENGVEDPLPYETSNPT
ncbi:MAG: 7-cyano-7-deazaguanine synthase QueC [Promethearchaeota archaeon]